MSVSPWWGGLDQRELVTKRLSVIMPKFVLWRDELSAERMLDLVLARHVGSCSWLRAMVGHEGRGDQVRLRRARVHHRWSFL